MLLLDEGDKSDQEFEALYTKIGVPHNLAQLGVDLTQVEAIALSHGHMDHTGSLYPILEKIPGTIPLALHPGAFAGVRLGQGARRR